MNIVICSSSVEAGDRIEELVTGVQGTRIVARTSSSRETAQAASEPSVDMSIVDEASLEVGLAARRHIGPIEANFPLWIALLERDSIPTMVRFAQYGFDDAIVAPQSSLEIARHFADIKARRRSVHTNPRLDSIDIVPSLFTRKIVHSDAIDAELVDLLGQGLSDHDIGRVLDRSIQEVRNRLARLLEVNGLTNRTQLATLHLGSQLFDRLV